jgi:hypothetical protein
MTMSAFNKDRTSVDDLNRVDPQDFEITESLLNEGLANITISALSLNTHYEVVNGSSMRVFNVYHFTNRLSFYLPYGLSLLTVVPVIALGFLALHHNGVTAIDGGFVQLLMTTTGRTELEDAAGQGCLGGEENVPKALKKMKVRFGEMITENSVEREYLLQSGYANFNDSALETDAMAIRQEQHSVSSRTGSTVQNSPNLEASDGVEGAAEEVDGVIQSSGAEIHATGDVIKRRAGFGLLDETIPLEKRVMYGRSRTDTG